MPQINSVLNFHVDIFGEIGTVEVNTLKFNKLYSIIMQKVLTGIDRVRIHIYYNKLYYDYLYILYIMPLIATSVVIYCLYIYIQFHFLLEKGWHYLDCHTFLGVLPLHINISSCSSNKNLY